MEPVQLWTGRAACTLQAALRMSNESFAEHLGIAARTVAMWHQKPDRVPQPDVQRMLDTALDKADQGAQTRFTNGQTTVRHGRRDRPTRRGRQLGAGGGPDRRSGTCHHRREESGGSGGGSMGGWLHVAPSATAPPDGSDIGQILRWYRTREGLSQQAVAARLNTTQSRLSKLEKGTQVLRDVDELRRLARQLGIRRSGSACCPTAPTTRTRSPRTSATSPDPAETVRSAGARSVASSTPTARRSAISPPSCTPGNSASPARPCSLLPTGSRTARST